MHALPDVPVDAVVVSTGLQPITYPVTDLAIQLKRQQYAALKADTPQGYESVRLAIADCRKARVAIEGRRKELKADSLEFGRRVDQQAKTLTAMLEEIETPLQLLKDEVDEGCASTPRFPFVHCVEHLDRAPRKEGAA